MKDLRHQHVVSIFQVSDTDDYNGIKIFELEYCLHGDMRSMFDRCREQVGVIPRSFRS